jgi:aspartyl-tRNA(Asn)/glutamyl-tRNA(Gln) amidotransferase subunit C
MQRDEIFTLAKLAHIAVNETEAEYFAASISKIMNLVHELNAVDVQNIAAMTHPLADIEPLRPDMVTETNQIKALLANAPQTAAGLFLVPQVIES